MHTPTNTWFPQPPPKQYQDQFSHFAGLTVVLSVPKKPEILRFTMRQKCPFPIWTTHLMEFFSI